MQSLRHRLFFSLFAAGVLLLVVGCNPIRSLGKNPEGQYLQRIEALPNYKNGEFQNLERLPVATDTALVRSNGRPRWLRMLKWLARKPDSTKPPEAVYTVRTDLKNTRYGKPTVVWFGHSSFLLKTAAATVLVDPNFSGYAGPFRGLVNAFKGSNVYDWKDMPVIDALVISHDHYDHLDYTTVKKLRKKVRRIVVPIGVGGHFRHWGFNPEIITELNWHDSVRINDALTVTAAPAHHRSNRTFESRKTLWASYVFKADGYKIYFSGDTGYSGHFKGIGERYGPFDLAMMECGQYNQNWSQSHMFPEQTAQAAADLKATTVVPVHWGKFAESTHRWNESVRRLLPAADSLGVKVSVPFIGQPYSVGDLPLRYGWWE